jgi:hypothetical protein
MQPTTSSQSFAREAQKELETRLSMCIRGHEQIIDEHNHPRYITYDFETDTHTLTHKPNHCEVEVLKVHDLHEYQKSLIASHSFSGYGCEHEFCEWLFQSTNYNSTVIAHNGAGYDAQQVHFKMVFGASNVSGFSSSGKAVGLPT